MFGRGIFGAVWKSRGGGQEFSAEVIRALVEVAGTPCSINRFALTMVAFFLLR